MLRNVFRLSVVAIAAIVSSSFVSADDTMIKVKVGDKFPNVPLAASSIEKAKAGAKKISIEDLKDRNVVVFFYPKALTPGCTVESCGFRDIIKEFPSDTTVLGASADDVALQTKFTEEKMLPFALLADTEKELIKSLGILNANGKTSQRVTFVIGKDGKIVKIYGVGSKIDTAAHPKEVLEFVKTLK